jgi:hypothetical protein
MQKATHDAFSARASAETWTKTGIGVRKPRRTPVILRVCEDRAGIAAIRRVDRRRQFPRCEKDGEESLFHGRREATLVGFVLSKVMVYSYGHV